MPEQISDHLGLAILQGDYQAGQRIREQDIADSYAVSRGPVREAIRILERRGMMEFRPRRGVYALAVSPDAIADLFNVRASLLGLSARCFTRVATPNALAELDARVARLQATAAEISTEPTGFALQTGRAGAVLYRNCGNGELMRMLRAQSDNSLWGLIWREYPLDFRTAERRLDAAALWARVAHAARSRDEIAAEELTRAALFASRDVALEVVSVLRGEPVDASKRLGSVPTPPCRP